MINIITLIFDSYDYYNDLEIFLYCLLLRFLKHISFLINYLKLEMERSQLDIHAVIGFSGDVHDALILHPDNEHLIYPLGSTVVIRHVLSNNQDFLTGHDHKISGNLSLIKLLE